MTCKQLGGACEEEFKASTFEEMAELSKSHGVAMMHDEAHTNAMKHMMELMKDPKAMQEWMDGKKREFEELPESE